MPRITRTDSESEFYKTRATIATKYHEDGKSWNEIAHIMNVRSPSAVRLWVLGKKKRDVEPDSTVEFFCKCCSNGMVRFSGDERTADCDSCGQLFHRQALQASSNFAKSMNSPSTARAVIPGHYIEKEFM